MTEPKANTSEVTSSNTDTPVEVPVTDAAAANSAPARSANVDWPMARTVGMMFGIGARQARAAKEAEKPAVPVTPAAVNSGLTALKKHIVYNPYKYSDNVGAQWFSIMYQESQEQTREFYERFAVFGYKLELNEFEQKALDAAAKKTNQCDRVSEVTYSKALSRGFNRRVMLRILLTGGGVASLKIGTDAVARATAGMIDKELGMEEFKQKMKELENPEQAKELQEKMQKALKNSEIYKQLQGITTHLKSWYPVYVGGLIMLAEIGARAAGVFKEIKEKKDQLVKDLDGFANMKLGRTDAVLFENVEPQSGRGV